MCAMKAGSKASLVYCTTPKKNKNKKMKTKT